MNNIYLSDVKECVLYLRKKNTTEDMRIVCDIEYIDNNFYRLKYNNKTILTIPENKKLYNFDDELLGCICFTIKYKQWKNIQKLIKG